MGRKRRILLLDDDPSVRRLVEVVLAGEGYDVVPLGTVAEALALPGPWDLLLLDRRLPDGDGLVVSAAHPGVPALYVTGVPHTDADLHKPFGIAELRHRVREALR